MKNSPIGEIPFALKVKKHIKEIVKTDQVQFDLWIINKFNVLPSDPRFQDLTEEQRDLLWVSYVESNPEIKRRMEDVDEHFDNEWKKLEEQKEDESEADDYNEDLANNFNEFINEHDLEIVRDSEKQAVIDRYLKLPKKESDDSEWVEVEDDDELWEEEVSKDDKQ